MISKNTSASTLNFKKQISPNTERIKTNPFSPFLTEKSESVQISSIETTMNNNSKKGSFVNNEAALNKLTEENKKCIDFTSKIIESVSKLKSFLNLSGKEYNNLFDNIKKTHSSSSLDNFNKLYDCIDNIHEGALELKYSFNTFPILDEDKDIVFDSTKINKNNIKLSSERRLNIYKKLFDICKHSLIEITEILINLLSIEECESLNNKDLINYQNTLFDTLEKKLQPNNPSSALINSVQISSDPSTKRSERTVCLIIEENIDKKVEQSTIEINQIKKSFNEDFDVGEEEHTTINENVSILHIPSINMSVNKPKDIDVKFRNFDNHINEDVLEIDSFIKYEEDNDEKLDDNDTIKQYETCSVTLKYHRRFRSLDINLKMTKRNREAMSGFHNVILTEYRKKYYNKEREFNMDFSVDKIERELDNIKKMKKKMKLGTLKNKGSSVQFNKVYYPLFQEII